MTRAGGIALICAVVLVAGCGSASAPPAKPKTLTHGRFIYLATHICARANRTSAALAKHQPKKFKMFIRRLRKGILLFEGTTADLQELKPPSHDAKAFQAMLATLAQEDVGAHEALASLRLHLFRHAKSLAHHLDAMDKQFRAQARRLDLPVCAKP
jgi:hypothetical protein